MPFSSNAPRPRHLFSVESQGLSRDPALSSPDLFWASRLGLSQPESSFEQPKPSTLPPRPSHLTGGPTTIEFFGFSGELWEEQIPASLRRAWSNQMELSLPGYLHGLMRHLPARLQSGELTAQMAGATLESLQITLRLADRESGDTLGVVEQEFCLVDEEATLEYTPVEGDMGWSFERTILENSVRLAEALGLSKVRLQVEGVRGYTWAKCGFVPDSDEDFWELFYNLEQSLGELDLTARTRTVVENLLQDRRPEAVWALSDLERVRVDLRSRRTSLGRALLDGTCWAAVLNLENRVALDRFERHLRRQA